MFVTTQPDRKVSPPSHAVLLLLLLLCPLLLDAPASMELGARSVSEHASRGTLRWRRWRRACPPGDVPSPPTWRRVRAFPTRALAAPCGRALTTHCHRLSGQPLRSTADVEKPSAPAVSRVSLFCAFPLSSVWPSVEASLACCPKTRQCQQPPPQTHNHTYMRPAQSAPRRSPSTAGRSCWRHGVSRGRFLHPRLALPAAAVPC